MGSLVVEAGRTGSRAARRTPPFRVEETAVWQVLVSELGVAVGIARACESGRRRSTKILEEQMCPVFLRQLEAY